MFNDLISVLKWVPPLVLGNVKISANLLKMPKVGTFSSPPPLGINRFSKTFGPNNMHTLQCGLWAMISRYTQNSMEWGGGPQKGTKSTAF